MKLLIIPAIMEHNTERIESLLFVFACIYSCVLSAVLIDLFFGVRRAINQNIARTSYGYRRTVKKLTTYFGLIIMLSIADVAASVIFKLPYFTIIGALGIIIVEAKSVYENIKQEDKQAEKIKEAITAILKNGDKIKEITDYLNTKTQ